MVVGHLFVSTALTSFAIRWLKNIQYWLLPGTCVLCESCHAQLCFITRACRHCALPIPAATGPLCGHCRLQPAPFRQAVAALTWAPPASQLISQFKYQARLAPGRVLGSVLAHELRLHYADQPLPELIVPVPLHPAKLRRRGFNQSLLLARQLAQSLQLPCTATLLRRVRDTPQQQGLSREERQQNLGDAFALDLRQLPQYAGLRSIALVDDVITTQSTARAVATVLQQGWVPAPDIHLWALARA